MLSKAPRDAVYGEHGCRWTKFRNKDQSMLSPSPLPAFSFYSWISIITRWPQDPKNRQREACARQGSDRRQSLSQNTVGEKVQIDQTYERYFISARISWGISTVCQFVSVYFGINMKVCAEQLSLSSVCGPRNPPESYSTHCQALLPAVEAAVMVCEGWRRDLWQSREIGSTRWPSKDKRIRVMS